MYSVVLFAVFACFEVALIHKRFIWDDIYLLNNYPIFYQSMAVAVLFFEFRWQRILLTSNLQFDSGKCASLLQQLFHPSFWPLNIKMIGYFILLLMSFEPHFDTSRVVYAATLIHIAFLLFLPTYLQRDLFLPMFVLSYMISTPQEKILLCMYSVVLHFLSNTLERPTPSNRHILPALVVAIISSAHYYFSVLYESRYKLDGLNVAVPGIEDVTKYPNFSVLIMGIHYFGVFLMVIPFLVRLTVPSPPLLRPFKVGWFMLGHVPVPLPPSSASVTSPVARDRRYVMTFLAFSAALATFLYYIFSGSERSDEPMIWAATLCVMAIGYGATVVCNEFVDALYRGLRFMKCFVAAKLQ